MKKELVSLSKYLKQNGIVSEAIYLDSIIKKHSYDMEDLYSLPTTLVEGVKSIRDSIISPFNIMLDELSSLCLSLSAASNEKTSLIKEIRIFVKKIEDLINFAIQGADLLEKYKILEQGASQDYKDARDRIRLLREEMSVLDPMTGEMSYNYNETASNLCETARIAVDGLLSTTDPKAWYEGTKNFFDSVLKDLESIF
jgi:predicted DNA-binding protein